MHKPTRRQFLAALGAAAAYGAARGGRWLYNSTSPTLRESKRFEQIPFATLPLALQSHYQGRIEKVFVANSDHSQAETAGLCDALAKYIDKVVLFGEAQARAPNVRGVEMDTFAIYMRDHFLATRGGELLVSPISEIAARRTHRNVRHIIEEVAAEGHTVRSAPFRFIGGQVIQADRYTRVPKSYEHGRQFIVDATEHYSEAARMLGVGIPEYDLSLSNSWLPGLMRDRFGTEIKDLSQVFRAYKQMGLITLTMPEAEDVRGHIDLLMTPVHKEQSFIGDNKLGLKVIQSLPMSALQDYLSIAFQNIAERTGRKEADAFVSTFKYLREHGETPRKQSYTIDAFSQSTSTLDEVAQAWSGRDIRIPALLAMLATPGKHSICCSYANALLDEERKVAFVPVYRIKALDEVALEAYDRAGYKTVPIPFTETSLQGAGVHCATFELRR